MPPMRKNYSISWTSMPAMHQNYSIFWTSMPQMHQNYSIFWTSMPPMHQHYSISLDLNASNASELFHIIGPQCLQCLRAIPYFGPRGTATTAAAATAAAAAVSQELWNLGGALVQRAQEQNIPCGESLTSTSDSNYAVPGPY